MKRNNPGLIMKLYRIEHWLYLHHFEIISKAIYSIMRGLFSCSIPPSTRLGKGVMIAHSIGIVIHQNTSIGDNSVIYQNVTIGNAGGPQIGKNCIIGTGAVILGDITIGDNVKVGANCVVLHDIPDDATVVGVPGRIVKIGNQRVAEEVKEHENQNRNKK